MKKTTSKLILFYEFYLSVQSCNMTHQKKNEKKLKKKEKMQIFQN
jgi:hypothetical protein